MNSSSNLADKHPEEMQEISPVLVQIDKVYVTPVWLKLTLLALFGCCFEAGTDMRVKTVEIRKMQSQVAAVRKESVDLKKEVVELRRVVDILHGLIEFP